MKRKRLLMLIMAVTVLICNGVTVTAAPERMRDGTIFDAEYYAQMYPDVVQALGTDAKALYQHYVTFGMEEGRQPISPEDAQRLAEFLNSARKITISFAGDCTLGTYKGQSSWNLFGDYYNQYGASYYFQNVREIFENDDITFVNLEGALTNYKQTVVKTYPIKGEPTYVDVLKSGMIEVVNLANNHTFDCGRAGYDECRRLLEENGIYYCGDSYTSIVDKNGVRVGFIGLNCWSISDALQQSLQNLIVYLKNNQCDIVCVMFHGGIERDYVSNNITETFAHNAIDYGADIVVGTHPHVVQGIEIYNGKVICYSLGNFSFGANKNPSDKDTFIFQQSFIVGSDGTVFYGKSKVIPCKISSTDAKNDYCPTPQTGEEYNRIIQKLASCSLKYPVSYFN